MRADEIRLVLQGRKTQTCRKRADRGHCLYRPGRAYSLQPYVGASTACVVTITAVRAELLSDLTLRDAQREGYRTTDEFREAWKAAHGRWDPDLPVWVISFVVGDHTDQPRLLAATPGRVRYVHAPGSKRQVVARDQASGDYTSSPHLAMAGEPEAIPAGLQATYSQYAHARDSKRRQETLEASRDKIRAELTRMREALADEPNRQLSKSVRELSHKLDVLDAKLHAA